MGARARFRVLPGERKSKTPKLTHRGPNVSSSPGRTRTYNQLVNSELRYHCATGESLESIANSRQKSSVSGPFFRPTVCWWSALFLYAPHGLVTRGDRIRRGSGFAV